MNDSLGHPYIILPFNFMRLRRDTILAVNVAGEYLALPEEDFQKFVAYKLLVPSSLYYQLKAKHFLMESSDDTAIELLAIKFRTKKSFLSDFTALHMFVVTLRCNQKCIYCHASSVDRANNARHDMSFETAQKAVDLCLMSPSKSIKIEFQGGEPLLNFDTIKFIVEYANKKASQSNKKLEFVLCSNLTLLTEDILNYLKDHNVFISTSLDGPQHVHDSNRSYRNGTGTYNDVLRSLDKARKYLAGDKISALMTTTKYSLKHAHEIIDEYVNKGFNSIFVRPLNPFGFAKQNIHTIGYSASEYIDFYKELLQYVIGVNLKGGFIEEAFTSLLLNRILTPFSSGFVDLQFPAGTGISGVIYDHDGNVYLSDESRMLSQMGDNSFCMGNLHKNTYKELFHGNLIQDIVRNTLAESLPGCSDCAFQVFCGIDPIRNYVVQGDIMGHRPSNDSCLIQKEIMKYLFEFILKNDKEPMDVFWSWLTGRHLSEIRTSCQ